MILPFANTTWGGGLAAFLDDFLGRPAGREYLKVDNVIASQSVLV